MYVVNVRPEMSGIPAGITLLGSFALAACLGRSALWIGIYRNGAGAVAALGSDREAAGAEALTGILDRLAKLLVTSSILDVLLLPAIFLMDVFFPFTLSSVHLGLIMLAAMLLERVATDPDADSHLRRHARELVEILERDPQLPVAAASPAPQRRSASHAAAF